MTETILLAVALWCGSPTGVNSGFNQKIQACREQLLTCLATGEVASVCFTKARLK